MDQASKRRGRPLPGARSNIKPIIYNLEEALAVEIFYRPNLLVIQHDIMPGEVTLKSRDGVVYLIRFLKFWFNVRDRVYFSAVTYLDLFIARMKVQEKYLKCVAFACFYVAMIKEDHDIKASEVASVSYGNFGVYDLLRMANIIREKSKVYMKTKKLITCADFLKIYLKFLSSANFSFRDMLDQDKLLTKLELLIADSSCAFFRPSTLSFTLLRLEVDKLMSNTIATKNSTHIGELIHTLAIMKELQLRCKVKSAELVSCSHHSSKVLKQYNNEERCQNNMYLRWKYLPPVCKVLNVCSSLDVIKEKPCESHSEKVSI